MENVLLIEEVKTTKQAEESVAHAASSCGFLRESMFDEKRSSDFMLQTLTGHEASIYYDSPDYMVDVINALLQNKLQKVWKL